MACVSVSVLPTAFILTMVAITGSNGGLIPWLDWIFDSDSEPGIVPYNTPRGRSVSRYVGQEGGFGNPSPPAVVVDVDPGFEAPSLPIYVGDPDPGFEAPIPWPHYPCPFPFYFRKRCRNSSPPSRHQLVQNVPKTPELAGRRGYRPSYPSYPSNNYHRPSSQYGPGSYNPGGGGIPANHPWGFFGFGRK